MKKYVVSAAALMLGTSALAWAPAEDLHAGVMQAGTAIAAMSAVETPYAAASEAKGAMKAQTVAWTADDGGKKTFAGLDDSLVETAAAEGFKDSAETAAGQPEVETAALVGKKDSATAGAETGMGGPVEEAQGYPSCRPGRGDDNCIQLYERGVHRSLAAWKDSDSGVAMGGPLEPVGDAGKDTPTGEDHSATDHGAHAAMPADAATGTKPAATAEMAAEADAAAAAKPAATEAPATPGVGGPIEARSDYPPCRPGRGDDNCIQLYERGMTGRKD